MTTYTAHPENPQTPRRRGLLQACATAAVLLAGALAGGAAFTGAAVASTDVVDAARAALPDRGGITHYRMRVDWSYPELGRPTAGAVPGLPDRVGAALPAPFGATDSDFPVFKHVIERWSAVEPLRDRSTWHLALPDGSDGTEESSYADGTFLHWTSWNGQDPRVVTLSEAEREQYEYSQLHGQRVWEHNATWTADPIGGIRTMLNNQMLRNTGRSTFEGRSVLRLVGEEPGTEENGSPGAPIAYEYLVDPYSFAPVRVTSTRTVRSPGENGEPGQHVVASWTFQVFERLPLNASTQHLLVVGGGH